MERHISAWKEILVKCISDKGRVSGIYKELSKLSSKKSPKQSNEQMGKDTNRHFTQEDTPKANKHRTKKVHHH